MDRPTVLVIDYEPRNLAATVEPLTKAGYHVEVARDGIAGLDAFRRLQPPVVFMEAMLPKKHAFEVCQEIRRAATGRKTRVFILGASTIAASQQLKAVRQYGADKFLPRPVDGETLVSLCSPVLPGPNAPRIPEVDLLQPMPVEPAAEAASQILAELEAPIRPLEPLDLSSMTEDDIMAQLDHLLPSVPAAPTSVPTAGPASSPTSIPVAPRPGFRAAAPKAAAPAPRPKPATRPTPAASPVRATMPPPVVVPSPAPELRPPSVEAAPTPAPRRSRMPMILAACVLAAAGVGSWLLLRPGNAAGTHLVQSVPLPELAPQETTVPEPAPTPTPLQVESGSIPEEKPPAQLHVSAAPSSTPPLTVPPKATASLEAKREAAPADKKPVSATLAPAPQTPAPSTPTKDAASSTVAAETTAAESQTADIPLPLAPPRLEPLPVGSDAARPRMSPDVFVRRASWGSLVELRDVDKAPVPLDRPAPVYPAAARQMRRQGEVEMRLLIDAQGQVAGVELLSGGRGDFGMAAERAARLWKYRPAMKDGVPVQVKIVEKVTFKL